MENAIKLRSNERVEFEVDDEVFKSSVQDVISDSSIALSIPINGSKSYLPVIGEKVEFFIFIKNEYHKYTGILKDRKIEGGLRLLIIENLKHIGKIQRRENFRIPISVDVSYLKITKEAGEKGVAKNIYKILADKFIVGHSVDLSAGGIRILIHEKIEINSFLMLKVKLSSEDEICVLSQIIRVEKGEDIKLYKIGCKFLDLDELDKEKMIRYIFEKSRELVKR